MKGPGYKVTGDVRRTWRCAKCGCERKLAGDVTTLYCGCQEESWMKIVAERVMSPRPLQRPSDVERRPIDFGIEPPPPAPVKAEATIIKSAVERDVVVAVEETVIVTTLVDTTPAPSTSNPSKAAIEPAGKADQETPVDDDWGDGIL